MRIGFFFNQQGIVFISGTTSRDGRRTFALELDARTREEWMRKLTPFMDRKFDLMQMYTQAASPRVAFSLMGDDEDTTHLTIFSGQPGRALSELLLQLNPPIKPPYMQLDDPDTGHLLILR